MGADPHIAPPLRRCSAPPTGNRRRPPPAQASAAFPAVPATILATEHWSLLGTRGMLWNELMSRISIHLTVSSASLVVLALVAQATGLGAGFWVMAIGLASMLLVLGSLTLLRVSIGSQEDHLLIAGMNRLRGAYRDLAAGVLGALIASVSGGSTVLVVLVGTAAGVAYLVGSTLTARRIFGRLSCPGPPYGVGGPGRLAVVPSQVVWHPADGRELADGGV
ncbi:hypothetical protein, partial [Sinomonas soli]